MYYFELELLEQRRFFLGSASMIAAHLLLFDLPLVGRKGVGLVQLNLVEMLAIVSLVELLMVLPMLLMVILLLVLQESRLELAFELHFLRHS